MNEEKRGEDTFNHGFFEGEGHEKGMKNIANFAIFTLY